MGKRRMNIKKTLSLAKPFNVKEDCSTVEKNAIESGAERCIQLSCKYRNIAELIFRTCRCNECSVAIQHMPSTPLFDRQVHTPRSIEHAFSLFPSGLFHNFHPPSLHLSLSLDPSRFLYNIFLLHELPRFEFFCCFYFMIGKYSSPRIYMTGEVWLNAIWTIVRVQHIARKFDDCLLHSEGLFPSSFSYVRAPSIKIIQLISYIYRHANTQLYP